MNEEGERVAGEGVGSEKRKARGEGGKRGRRSRAEDVGEGSSSSSGGTRRPSGTPYPANANGSRSTTKERRPTPEETSQRRDGRKTTSKEAIKAINDAIKNEENPKGLSAKRKCIFALGALMVACGVGVALGVGLTRNLPSDYDGYGFHEYAVTSEHGNCSEIGRDVLASGGSAVDAAIAAVICTSVFQPQCSGMGGGLVLTAYKKETHEVDIIDALPAIPSNPLISSRQRGSLVGVPGQLAGLWLAHKRHGKLPWKKLLSPTISILRKNSEGDGVPLSQFMLQLLRRRPDISNIIANSPSLCSIFCDEMGQPAILESFHANFRALLRSLEEIATVGQDYFYKYTFGPATATKTIEIEVKKKGGTLSSEDLTSYQGIIRQPFVITLNGYTFLAPPLPSLGFIVPTCLNLLSQYDLRNKQSSDFYNYVVGAIKIVLMDVETILQEASTGDQWENLPTYLKLRSDSSYIKELKSKLDELIKKKSWSVQATLFNLMETDLTSSKHCGSNVHVLSQNGDGASVSFGTSTYFGAGFASNSTGVIFNSAMYNFSPGTQKSGDRLWSPLGAMTVLDETGELRLQVAGVGGGIAGIAGAVFTAYRHLWLNEMPFEATSAPVMTPGIEKNVIYFESKMDSSLVQDMSEKGHKMIKAPDSFVFGTDVIARMDKDLKKTFAYVDRRKGEDAFASGK